MPESAVVTRRRRWPLFVSLGVVIALAVLWSGAWFFVAARAQEAIENWRSREARAGRVYSCGTQTITGFPFRIEVRCADAGVQLPGMAPPHALAMPSLVFALQVYQPALAIAEISSPLTLGEIGKPVSVRGRWGLAQASIRASLAGAERVSIVADDPAFARIENAGGADDLAAQRIELHGRRAEGSTADNPAADLVLRLTAAVAPGLHPALARAFDADVAGVLHGAVDLTPKPWPVLFREWQAHGGRLEISKARVQQGDVIAVGAGTLSLTPRGGLNGQLQITVVELAQALQEFGINRIVSQGDIGSAIDALDRMLPGLGAIARQNAAPGIVASLGAIGQNTTLEGKPAVSVLLRFDDGDVQLGPFRIGRVPPLF